MDNALAILAAGFLIATVGHNAQAEQRQTTVTIYVDFRRELTRDFH